jgi:glycosyltransferase involved in cell wall biosynthesis
MKGMNVSIEKLRGVVSVASNSYDSPTGYGVQTKLLIDRLVKHGLKVSNLSNYGLEGRIEEIKTPYGKITHYPRGFKPYSDDVIPVWHADHKSKNPDIKDAIITLYDSWVYNDMQFDGQIFAWTPLDHVTLPPKVLKFLLKPNVTPITMSPHGQRQLEAAGVESVYIPHAIDTKVMKPTDEVFGIPTRQYLDVPEDAFLVSMVSANKANGLVHRKALAEQFMAFSIFRQSHPDAYLYIHSEPSNAFGGFNIPNLLKACGLNDEFVRILNTDVNRTGYPDEFLAGVYTASDVMLQVSYGEGFGVPVVEAQACGTPVITSNWAATQDLAGEDSFLVDGQPFWDEPQQAFYNIPNIGSIVNALELAYEAPRGKSQASIDFARQFDVETVWNWYWMPLLREYFAS